MKHPKDEPARAKEAMHIVDQLKTLGLPEDDPDLQRVLLILDQFVEKGYGYSGKLTSDLGFLFELKLSLQNHIVSHVRIAKA